MKRKPLIAGNWKMHTTLIEAKRLARQVAESSSTADDREILIAPPFTALAQVAEAIAGSSVKLAGQNVCWADRGAYTGEISPTMLKDCGACAAIVGHSERRQIFRESLEIIDKRVQGALNAGLMTIFCIGETLKERESGKTFAILQEQIQSGCASLSSSQLSNLVLAYEPVWAIGTGKTASKEQAQEAHAYIRSLVAEMFEKDIAEQIRILYGGSVKPANVDELMAQPDIDGALVGGAALDIESFGRIIHFQ